MPQRLSGQHPALSLLKLFDKYTNTVFRNILKFHPAIFCIFIPQHFTFLSGNILLFHPNFMYLSIKAE